MELKEVMTIDEADEFEHFESFDSYEEAKQFLEKNPDYTLYTQVDGDNGEVYYDKGLHYVNRTGWYICVK